MRIACPTWRGRRALPGFRRIACKKLWRIFSLTSQPLVVLLRPQDHQHALFIGGLVEALHQRGGPRH
jgi:hypothetical protein